MSTKINFDNDIAGDFPIHSEVVKIGANQNLKRGTILAVNSAGADKGLVLVAGDAKPVARLMADVNTGANGGYALVARTGCFADGSIVVGEGANVQTVKDELAARCLFFKAVDDVKD